MMGGWWYIDQGLLFFRSDISSLEVDPLTIFFLTEFFKAILLALNSRINNSHIIIFVSESF